MTVPVGAAAAASPSTGAILGSSAVQAGGGLFGSIVSAIQSRRAWKRQIAYNDPSAQMARLKRAGINPAMAFSKGSVQNTAQLEKPPGFDFNVPNPLEQSSKYQDTRVKRAQVDNLEAQNNLIKQQAINEGMKQLGIWTQSAMANRMMESDIKFRQFMNDFNMSMTTHQASVLENQVLKLQSDINRQNIETRIRRKDFKYYWEKMFSQQAAGGVRDLVKSK